MNTSPQIDAKLLIELENVAVQAARVASKVVRSKFGETLVISQKGAIPGVNIVTDADTDAQKVVVEEISKNFPAHTILGEEKGLNEPEQVSDFIWAVDPIDGTKNFANGAIEFGIEVGVMYRGVPVAGAIWTLWSNSERSRMISARLGGGTRMDGKLLKIRDINDGIPVYDRHAIVSGDFFKIYERGEAIRKRMGDIRIIGSISWEVAMLVTNSAQYVVSGVAHTWDFCAALIILKEAGCKVWTADGSGKMVEFNGWEVDDYENDLATFRRIRDWRGAAVASGPKLAEFLRTNLRIKRPYLKGND